MSFFQINLQEMRVLVVDDSSTARKFMTEMLHGIGVGHVTTAAEGAEAIEKLRLFAADIMVCDLHMVPIDGIELTRTLRNASDSPNPYLPVIMLTADATEAQMNNALAAGANAFMAKPVKMSVLHKKLLAIFSHPLVFVRDGRNLRPVLAAPIGEAPAPPAAVKAVPPDQVRGPPQEPADSSKDEPVSPEQQPLTRRDMGLR